MSACTGFSAHRLILGVFACGALPAMARAADAEQLDEGLLEYLAEFDDKDDDWSWFDSHDEEDSRAAKQQPAAREATATAEKTRP